MSTTHDATRMWLQARRTLCEASGAPRPLAALCNIAAGSGEASRVLVLDPPLQPRFDVDPQRCFGLETLVDGAADPLVIVVVAELLAALDRADPDLGWSAVVAGDSLRSELLLSLCRNGGARRVVNLRPPAAAAPQTHVDQVVTWHAGAAESDVDATIAQLRGPILAFETGGGARQIEGILALLPPRSTLVLLGGGTGAAAVNFYRDVHRKNTRLYGCSSHSVRTEHVRRAMTLVTQQRIWTPAQIPVVTPAAAERVAPASPPWIILEW